MYTNEVDARNKGSLTIKADKHPVRTSLLGWRIAKIFAKHQEGNNG